MAAIHAGLPIEERVKKLIAEHMSIATDEIQNSAALEVDLGLDSLGLLEIVMDVEDEFELEINDDDAIKLTTVQEVINYVALRV